MRIELRASFALLSALFAVGCSRGRDAALQTLPAVGSAVPPFSYPGLFADTVTSASLHNQPAVVAFWSSTCPASREALAAIQSLAAAYAGRGVRVVLLADDADAMTLPSTLQGVGDLRVGVAAGTLRATFSQTHLGPWRRALPLPSFLVVNGDGRIVYRWVGIERAVEHRLSFVRAQLDTLLARQAGA